MPAPPARVIGAALEGRRYLGPGLDADEGLAVDIPEVATHGEAVTISARQKIVLS